MGQVVKGFVASWFFPPSTSSEGIVAYKLLRNSEFQFDVCNSLSNQWGYDASMEIHASNIRVFSINTQEIDIWVEEAIALFEKRHPYEHYDFIMTRSMPPESILVGSKIKELYPQIKWIASFGDPIANNPYELKAYVDDCPSLNPQQKKDLRADLKGNCTKWESRPEPGIRLLCKLQRWEGIMLEHADCVICPTITQMKYALGAKGWLDKCFVLPHAFDPKLFLKEDSSVSDNKQIVFSFLGHLDQYRSLLPLIQAIHILQLEDERILEQVRFNIIGNVPVEVKDMVFDFFLQDCILVESSVEYENSLRIMQASDWLIHVDAFFPEIEPGGSIFFAGKLADYLGSGKPILALTGEGSPADRIVRAAGGVSVLPWDIYGIADCLRQILLGKKPAIDFTYREQYNSQSVAARFDKRIGMLLGKHSFHSRTSWPKVAGSNKEKTITVCVPSYNVAPYLDRCLYTLVSGELSEFLEVLVINDGSTDLTQIVAEDYQKQYPGIVTVINKENGGHGSTINVALDSAQGAYFMVIDGDDWVDSEQLSLLIADILQDGPNVDLISCNYHHVDQSNGISTPQVQSTRIVYNQIQRFPELDLEHVYFTMAGSLFRTEVLRKSGMRLQEKTYYVDVEYILLPIPFVDTVLFKDYFIYKYFRGNISQSVHIPNMVDRFEHHDRVLRRVINYYHEQNMTKAQSIYINQIIKRLLYTHYALMLTYDSEKARGCERCRQFDKFLVAVDKKLYKWIEQAFKSVKVARKHNYDYAAIERAERSVINKIGRLKGKIKSFIQRNILDSHIIRWLWKHR